MMLFLTLWYHFCPNFSAKQKTRGGTNVCGKAAKVWWGKVLTENSRAGKTWSSAMLFLIKNDTAIADRNVLFQRKIWYFSCRCDQHNTNRYHEINEFNVLGFTYGTVIKTKYSSNEVVLKIKLDFHFPKKLV